MDRLSLRTLDVLAWRWRERQRREDYRAAAVWAVLANAHRGEHASPVKLEDGFPSLRAPRSRLSVREQVEAVFDRWVP